MAGGFAVPSPAGFILDVNIAELTSGDYFPDDPPKTDIRPRDHDVCFANGQRGKHAVDMAIGIGRSDERRLRGRFNTAGRSRFALGASETFTRSRTVKFADDLSLLF
jgi:hypothetical protein